MKESETSKMFGELAYQLLTQEGEIDKLKKENKTLKRKLMVWRNETRKPKR